MVCRDRQPLAAVACETDDAYGVCARVVGEFGGTGFYDYYQIPARGKCAGGESESGEPGESTDGRVTGLNSPWGMIWNIVTQSGWTYHNVLWGVSWVNLRMMLADAAQYESGKQGGEIREARTAEEELAIINGLWGE